jgi:rfaE bifunctional protein nucleotidyltransferase chain/domain
MNPGARAKMHGSMPNAEAWTPPADGVGGKIAPDLERLRQRIERLKREGKRVVFTNGGFDLLHVGHVRALRHARSLGDHLVVALNGDRSIRAAKGPGRPLFPEAERAEVIASLGCVDTVYIFDAPTVDSLLAELKPHVHAKGPDYSIESVPERATVLAYGGETAIVGDPKNHSSTDLQRRLREGGT